MDLPLLPLSAIPLSLVPLPSCKGAYVCEDDNMPANGRAVPSTWKSCVLPVPSNGVYDCKDYLDDDANLINGGHCNQSKIHFLIVYFLFILFMFVFTSG